MPQPTDLNIISIKIVHQGLLQIVLLDELHNKYEVHIEPEQFYSLLGSAYQSNFRAYFDNQFGDFKKEIL